MIKAEGIYAKTNGGLDIIVSYYPQAAEVAGTNNKFKMRDEKTPSATLRKYGEVWKVVDFGDDGHTIGPIDIAMREEGISSFPQALFLLADRYGVERGLKAEINKPDIRYHDATPEEEEGGRTFELNEALSEAELKVLGPRVTADVCQKYSYFSVKSYTITKNRKTTTVSSNENYPIFLRDCGGFKKIYQPLNPEKGFRFFYHGEKPREYINGLDELEKRYKDYNRQLEKEFDNDSKNEDKPFVYTKLPEAIICSGERDALCAAALGYYPLWFNSEAYKLSEKEYFSISKFVEKIYNLPDLDETGIRKGVELATRFFDIHTIWLPAWLSTYKDMRGRPRKDLRDFVELRPAKKDFSDLLNDAMPMRFWHIVTNSKGQTNPEINSEYMIRFLRHHGFCRIKNDDNKSQKTLVHIKNNIVREIYPADVKQFLLEFLRSRYLDVKLRNLVRDSTRTSTSALSELDEVELDFTDFTETSQLFFFENATWDVTATGVKEYKHKEVARFVWDEELIRHRVKRTDPAFKISVNAETGKHSIECRNKNSNFFRFLINASRVHWRKELEQKLSGLPEEEKEKYRKENKFEIAGSMLNAEEIEEQMQHLINKIYTIGYVLHRYKSVSKAWCVFAVDNTIGSLDDSNGRSGKSFCFKALQSFMKTVTLPGRSRRLTDNPHIYERVTEHTDMVLIDDADAYFDLNNFFEVITGNVLVNPKNNKSFEVDFDKAPKFVITSNYILRRADSSTIGRVLFAAFSDYYHLKTDDNDYLESRSIHDDFGKDLMKGKYSEEEWNADINFFVDCCQFYLSTSNADKLQPPMKNIIEKSLLSSMGGESFLNWADVFFCIGGENVDKLVCREVAFQDFVGHVRPKNYTMKAFSRSLRSYCRYAEHIIELDPVELRNSQNRIIRKVEGKSKEMIYIRTTDISPEILADAQNEISDEKLPF